MSVARITDPSGQVWVAGGGGGGATTGGGGGGGGAASEPPKLKIMLANTECERSLPPTSTSRMPSPVSKSSLASNFVWK